MQPLNILTLHRLGNPSRRLFAVEELEYMLPLYHPEHNYIHVDGEYPVPDYIRNYEFDLIIINPTFLCGRTSHKVYLELREKFDFIAESDAVKFAFPQDDYYSSRMLESWMIDWKIDHLFSVCPAFHEVLYPNLERNGIALSIAYTGYVSPALRKVTPKPRSERATDICYRTLKSPPFAGSMSFKKYQLGDLFLANLPVNHGLALDISADRNDKIAGDRWLDFIQDAKFCLAGRSGSSLFDPDGEIRDRIQAFVLNNPDWQFSDVESACFAGLDSQYEFSAISPRNLEAAVVETVQIAHAGTADDYNGLFIADEHYLPIAHDASDIDVVLEKMRDTSYVERIIRNSRELVMDTSELHMEVQAKSIINHALALLEEKSKLNKTTDQRAFRQLCNRYLNEVFANGFRPSISFPHLQQLR